MTSTAFVLLVASASAATFGAVFLLPGFPKAQAAVAEPVERAPDAITQSSVYYPGCNAVRAAGKAPLYRDQPGYRPEMDGDDDGIACEPHVGSGSDSFDRGGGWSQRRRR